MQHSLSNPSNINQVILVLTFDNSPVLYIYAGTHNWNKLQFFFQSSDVRNGWPYDYHNTFWDNYYRKYGTQNYEYDFSIEWPFPTGPRCRTEQNIFHPLDNQFIGVHPN